MVGVNAYVEGDDGQPPLLAIDPKVEADQLARLAAARASRDEAAAHGALAAVTAAAGDSAQNLMPVLIEASRARCTVGEQMAAMEQVFGTWTEPALS